MPEQHLARDFCSKKSLSKSLHCFNSIPAEEERIDCDSFNYHSVGDADPFHHHDGNGSGGDDNNDHDVQII